MKRLLLIILVYCSISSSQISACSFIPGMFCDINFNVPGFNVIVGEIILVDSDGIEIEIIDVLNGMEERDTIRVWNGTDQDCNGPISYASSNIGNSNDKVIVFLELIDSIENSWDIIGDYRNHYNTQGEYPLQISNDSITGYIKGYASLLSDGTYIGDENKKIAYNDFKEHWSSNSNSCNTLGLKESRISKTDLIFNNPIHNSLYLNFSGTAQKRSFEIYSNDGKRLKNLENDYSTVEIRFEEFQSGLYLIRIREEQGNRTIKVVKQ
ncbi:MAG: T9SS type A sorting domain-containing protein [Flavobacteriales bacterium]|nr:T9SS type A sorting domain-containing protein [Flavobacteriales bacterium]